MIYNDRLNLLKMQPRPKGNGVEKEIKKEGGFKEQKERPQIWQVVRKDNSGLDAEETCFCHVFHSA